MITLLQNKIVRLITYSDEGLQHRVYTNYKHIQILTSDNMIKITLIKSLTLSITKRCSQLLTIYLNIQKHHIITTLETAPIKT